MSILPDFVLRVVTAHLTPLLDWFGDRLYTEFLPYVGYRIFEAGPDHTTLERFEQWVGDAPGPRV